jgi:hypothetical protein
MTKVIVEHAESEPPEDIFFQGNIVVSNDEDKWIVLVTWNINEERFNGVILYTTGRVKSGDYETGYSKSCFKQFHGKIILES